MGDTNELQMMEDVALEGYFVLAEKSRTPEDKAFIKETIQRVFKVEIDEQSYYERFFNQKLEKAFADAPINFKDIPKVVASR